jgi:hypothetical protein
MYDSAFKIHAALEKSRIELLDVLMTFHVDDADSPEEFSILHFLS